MSNQHKPTENISATWTAREYIFQVFQQWHLPVLYFLIGSFASLGISQVTPTGYKATRELVVTVDFDQAVRNLDDYKNAQIRQLEALAFSDETIKDAIQNTPKIDPSEFNILKFQESADLAWRDVGVWVMSIKLPDSKLSVALVENWEMALLNQLNIAQEKADQVEELRLNLDDFKPLIRFRIVRERRIQAIMKETRPLLASLDTSQLESPDSGKLRLIQNIGDQIIDRRLLSEELMPAIPNETASTEDMQVWLAAVRGNLKLERQLIATELKDLISKRAKITNQMLDLRRSLKGISSGLNVDHNEFRNTEVEAVRPTGAFIMFGGFFGLVIWLVVVWIRINKNEIL